MFYSKILWQEETAKGKVSEALGFCWVTRRNGVRDAAWRQERQRMRQRERLALDESKWSKMETKGEGKSGRPFPKCQSESRVPEHKERGLETGQDYQALTLFTESRLKAKGRDLYMLPVTCITPEFVHDRYISVSWTLKTLKSQLCGCLEKLWQSRCDQCHGRHQHSERLKNQSAESSRIQRLNKRLQRLARLHTQSHAFKKQVIGSEWALCYQLTAKIAASASVHSVYLISEARLSNKDRSGIQPRSSRCWCTLGWLDLTKVDNWTESLVRWASQTSGESCHFHGSRLIVLRLSLEVRLSKKQQSARDWRVSRSCSCQSGAGVSSKPQSQSHSRSSWMSLCDSESPSSSYRPSVCRFLGGFGAQLWN